MKLSPIQRQVLQAMAEGATLKSHRYLDGRKIYQLHPLDGRSPHTIRSTTVDVLRRHGLVDSNKKFPAATYLLTDKGRTVAADLIAGEVKPLGLRDYYGE